MNTQQEDMTLYNDLFHYLTGDCYEDKNGHQIFYLYNSDNAHYAYYTSDGYFLIDDPAVDSSFKHLFLNNPIRLTTFLNEIYFEQNNMKIIELNYMVGEFYDIGKRYNLDTLKSDIACKAKIIGEKNILINIEIQINWLSNLDDRLFEYGACIRNANSNVETKKEQERLNKSGKKQKAKRIFNDVIVIGLLITNTVSDNTHTNQIDLWRKKNNNNNRTLVPGFNILEINVCEIVDEIKRKKDVKLFDNYITKNGADWLKLIGLRFWAKKKDGSLGQYIFPKIKKNEIYSQNNYINEVISELIEGSDFDINCFSQLEEVFSNNYHLARKTTQLEYLYILLLKGSKDLLKYLPIELKYTEKEVTEIMFKRNSIRLDILQELINYLKERGCISTDKKQ